LWGLGLWGVYIMLNGKPVPGAVKGISTRTQQAEEEMEEVESCLIKYYNDTINNF